jgi:HPt (histidine-containing phosphotransfer) domain-containing protein
VIEQDADAPVLDPEVLERLERELGGSRERVATILAVYLEEVQPYRVDIREASQADDAERLEFAAHRLGSASVLVGATKLTRLCRELESLNRASTGDRGKQLVALIEAEADAVYASVLHVLHPGAQ